MGIEYNAVRILKLAKSKNIIFDKVATIGRQGLHMKLKNIEKLLEGDLSSLQDQTYSENLFKILGAKVIDSFDYSNYENCTFVCDMNKAIDDKFKNKYDLVFDGGTLEHVFNFPVAIKNCMEMLKVDGYFISVTCCNNFPGHGFYQFSPELFFRIFNQENGFEILNLFISENNIWYEVKNPEEVKSRVIFRNNHETSLLVFAKKVAEKNIFQLYPYQSDYVSLWKDQTHERITLLKKIIRKFRDLCYKYFVKYDKRFFTKIN